MKAIRMVALGTVAAVSMIGVGTGQAQASTGFDAGRPGPTTTARAIYCQHLFEDTYSCKMPSLWGNDTEYVCVKDVGCTKQ